MVTSTTTGDLQGKKKESPDKQENLWSSILSEVQNQGNTKLPGCKNVLVLGDNESGKTTLVAKLQGVEDSKKGSGLEYAYIDVRDEYRDDNTRLSVWVLDGDSGHNSLLKFALTEETYLHTFVILTVAMTTPWGWMEQLQQWVEFLKKHIEQLDLEKDQREKAQEDIVRSWQSYCEPGDELDPNSPVKRVSKMSRSSTEDLDDLLTEGALTVNLGVQVIVVVTKTDYMSTLEKDFDYKDEHFDFMQQWIRKFCLQYGAALFYTSAKEDKNCDLLYKYLTHKIYDLPFRTPALVVEKDAVLIPSGWDNLKKISILHENLLSCKPDDIFQEIIVAPATRKVANKENEVFAEDEQTFLSRQLTLLQSNVGLPPITLLPGQLKSSDSPIRSPASLPMPRTPNNVVINSPNKKLDVKMVPGSPGGEGVLANFFNSLLHKKSASPSQLGGGTPKPNNEDASPEQNAAMRSDAAAELDRLTRSKKIPNMDLDTADC